MHQMSSGPPPPKAEPGPRSGDEIAGRRPLPIVDRGRLRDSYGIETFKQLFRAAPGIPILVLAAAQDEHVARAAVQYGAQDYLLKSIFSGCLLPQAVQSMVGRSSPTRF
jgi:DNA-binding NarL/FixJ family response regulator